MKALILLKTTDYISDPSFFLGQFLWVQHYLLKAMILLEATDYISDRFCFLKNWVNFYGWHHLFEGTDSVEDHRLYFGSVLLSWVNFYASGTTFLRVLTLLKTTGYISDPSCFLRSMFMGPAQFFEGKYSFRGH